MNEFATTGMALTVSQDSWTIQYRNRVKGRWKESS
jgi:hypothetical protein